jgi:pimeloyl-ACP methyl ester carboxylesterase
VPLRAVPTAQWRTARLGDARVSYLEAGQGEPFVFLHGWGLTPRSYAGGVTRLCQAGIRVIAPALPGFGGSTPLPVRRTTVDGYADRIAELIDELALPSPVFLAGHSLGGGVALRLAARRPDLVRSLTLVNSVGGSPGAIGRRNAEGMTSRPWWQWALAAVTEASPRELPRLLPSFARDLVPNALRRPLATAAGGYAALTADLADDARDLVAAGLPVLFVWGDRDRLIAPGAFTQVESAMPPEIVSGRHSWVFTNPEAFSQLMHNALVVHAMLERKVRGQSVVLPKGTTLSDLFPPERRRRARLPLDPPTDTAAR